MQFTDEWLIPTVEPLLPPDTIASLRQESAGSAAVWDVLVGRKLLTDAQIIEAVAARFRFKVAGDVVPDTSAQDIVSEQLVRRFNVLPLHLTDSYLEVATANPFDIDAEKMLAFASGREVRMLLASPSSIRRSAIPCLARKIELTSSTTIPSIPATTNPADHACTRATTSMYEPVARKTTMQTGKSRDVDAITPCQSSISPTVRARARRPAASLVTAEAPAATTRARR